MSAAPWQSGPRTFVSRILPEDQAGAGVALSHLNFQTSMLTGLVLAGLIIAGWGLAACYVVEALACCAALCGIAGLPALKPLAQTGRAGVRAIGDGMRFIALFPAMNEERFGGNPETLGFLLSAIAIGGICASAASSVVTGSSRTGQVQLLATACWGASLAMAGLSSGLWPTLTFLAIAGAADTVAVVSRGTLLQLATPDALRERISAVEQVVGVGSPQLGNFLAGLMAGFGSPTATLAAGGGLCVLAVGGFALRNTSLRAFALSGRPARSREH